MRVERRVGRVVLCVAVRGLRVSRTRRFPGCCVGLLVPC